MSEHPSKPQETSIDHADLPEVVIAQAQAAASTNQPEQGPSSSESAPEGTREVNRSGRSPAHDRKSATGEETPIEQVPQLAYGPQLGQVDVSQHGFDTKAKVAGKGGYISFFELDYSNVHPSQMTAVSTSTSTRNLEDYPISWYRLYAVNSIFNTLKSQRNILRPTSHLHLAEHLEKHLLHR